MNTATRAVRQARFEQISFWRNPAAAFFTFAMPVLFLVIITALLGNDTATLPNGEETKASSYYIASILAFSVVTATFTNLAMGTTIARDLGILKRIRATPMPASAYLSGRVLSSLAITTLLVILVVAFGVVVYGVSLPTDTFVPFVVTTIVGAASFCALGLAVTSIVPNADAAPAVVNAIVLPLLFISGVFIPIDDGPEWIRGVAEIFPVRHYLVASIDSFLGVGDGWDVGALIVLTLWGLAGLAVAVRWFSWEPRR
jgi:ABC-2 type transport system permease protein